MAEQSATGISPPPSPSPPRTLLATPIPVTPSPRPLSRKLEGEEPDDENFVSSRLTSHFPLIWKQNESTGLTTLSSESERSAHFSSLKDPNDSESDDENETLASSPLQGEPEKVIFKWRNKERMRTIGVAIALCLNLGTDPPDNDKIAPCARTECGIDPSKYHVDAPTYAILKMIGSQLEEQFRNLQPRAKIKLAADPTVDMIRKTCTSLRRLAKTERVLVHFNGHGVPRPTRNGEIWAFNDDFTQYIPLSIFDLIRWAGHPSMFIFDCQSAGQLIPHFLDHERENERQFKQQLDEWNRNQMKRKKEQERRNRRELENQRLVKIAGAQNSVLLATGATGMSNPIQANGGGPNLSEDSKFGVSAEEEADLDHNVPENPKPVRKQFVVLVPCGAEENLPSSPQLPADLFTCCLTTPVQTALRWYILQNKTTMDILGIEQSIVNLIPGKANERKTLLGELNWIFTSVTDTIAWTALPRRLFQRLFRQDLLVATLLRHFLLAERIFRTLGCTPQSIPSLPSTWKHKMWDAWDQAVESFLIQLPGVIPAKLLADAGLHKAARIAGERHVASVVPRSLSLNQSGDGGFDDSPEGYEESRFFKDQLQGFEIWLSQPSTSECFRSQPVGLPVAPPEQLPIILQVLLAHQHRYAALDQLARFFDLGTWAVSYALSVGIFPYVLKLLQSPVPLLKSFLVRIWVRILDFDPTCRDDLNQAMQHGYFVRQFADKEDPEHAARAALVLCISCDSDAESKSKYLSHEIDKICVDLLQSNGDPVGAQGTASYQGHHRATSALSDEADSTSEASDERTNQPHAPLGSPHSLSISGEYCFSSEYQASSLARNAILICWSCLVLAKMWDGSEYGRARAINFRMYRSLEGLLAENQVPQIREAAVYALGRLLGPVYADSQQSGNLGEERSKSQEICDTECDLAVRLLKLGRHDGSPLVRREVIFSVSRFVMDDAHLGNFQLTVHFLSEYRQKLAQTQPALIDRLHETFGARGPKYMAIWLDLTRVFAVDPFPAVSQAAQILIRYVKGGVEARIAAIRGRAGEGTVSASSTTLSSTLESSTLFPPTAFLKSDLFERSKRQMCRSRVEAENDALIDETSRSSMARSLTERSRAYRTWSFESINWVGNEGCCEWWFGTSLGTSDGQSRTRIPQPLRAPYLQLLRSQRNSSEVPSSHGLSAPSATSNIGSVSAPGSLQPADVATNVAGVSVGSEHDLLRRFDQLPMDIFSSSSSTRQLRLASSVAPQLFRQSSGSLMRQGSGMQLSRSTDRLSQTENRMDETSRIDLSKHGLDGANPFLAVHHPFLPNLFVANQQTVSCFDYSSVRKKAGPQLASKFSNLNISATSITSVVWIDAHTNPLLMTYADDGHVRVWRDVISPNPQLASAFSPFDGQTIGARPSRASSLVECVSASSHLVCTSGQSCAMRIWDLATEKLHSELTWTGTSNSSTSRATCLSSSETESLFCAGFSDGSVRVFDRRLNPQMAALVIKSSSESAGSIMGMSKVSPNFYLSGVNEGGLVRVWDIRAPLGEKPTTDFHVECGNDSVFAFHPNAPILAYGPRKLSQNAIRLVALDNTDLGQLRVRSSGPGGSAFGFMGGASKQSRLLHTISWHPLELSLLVGTSDSLCTFAAADIQVRGVWSLFEMKIGSGAGGNIAQNPSTATVLTTST